MKFIHPYFLSAFVMFGAAFGIYTSAGAQQYSPTEDLYFELIHAGVSSSNTDSLGLAFEPYSLGLRVFRPMTAGLHLGLSYQITNQTRQRPEGLLSANRITQHMTQLLARYESPAGTSFIPWLQTGLQLTRGGDKEGYGPLFGAGVSYAVNHKTSVFAEVNGHMIFPGLSTSPKTFSYFSGGVRFSFRDAYGPADILRLVGPTQLDEREFGHFRVDVNGSVPMQIRWSFGDGTFTSGRGASHVYKKPGEYIVTATVINGNQRQYQDVAQMVVRVDSIPPEEIPLGELFSLEFSHVGLSAFATDRGTFAFEPYTISSRLTFPITPYIHLAAGYQITNFNTIAQTERVNSRTSQFMVRYVTKPTWKISPYFQFGGQLTIQDQKKRGGLVATAGVQYQLSRRTTAFTEVNSQVIFGKPNSILPEPRSLLGAGIRFTFRPIFRRIRDIRMDAELSGVAGEELWFFAQHPKATGPISYAWHFDDNLTLYGKTATRIFEEAGEYNVKLVVSNGEGRYADTLYQAISITTPIFFPLQNLAIDGPARLKVGEGGIFNAMVRDASEPIKYRWYFDDGTTAEGAQVNHQFTSAGQHQVTLTASNGGGRFTGTVYLEITVFDRGFMALQDLAIEGPTNLVRYEPVIFTAGVNQGTPPIKYEWTFSDGTIINGPVARHTITDAGEHNVVLNASNGNGFYAGSVRYKIKVGEPNPDSLLQMTAMNLQSVGSTLDNIDLLAVFKPETINENAELDMTGVSAQNDSSIFRRDSFVPDDSLWATAPCISPVIIINAVTEAMLEGTVGEYIAFMPEVRGSAPLAWFWDFGDGETSEDSRPVHRYQSAGVYKAVLRVSNCEGIDERTIVVVIHDGLAATNE